MINSPYKVLGVPEGASLDECTKAYKRLAKKYHPDLNPDDAQAEKRMSEINAAYDKIKNGDASSSPFESSNSRKSSSSPDYLTAVMNFLKNNQFSQALNLLSQIEDRNAKWYYLASVAYLGIGKKDVAINSIQAAIKMEPNNATYRDAYEKIQNGINPIGYVGFNPFDFGGYTTYTYDNDDSSYDDNHTRQYTYRRGNGGCLGRIFRFIIVVLVIRFILYIIMSFVGTTAYRNNYNYYPNSSYSQTENTTADDDSNYYSDENGQYYGQSGESPRSF